MEAGRGSAAGGGGLYAAQEPREPRQGEEKAGRRRQTPAAEGGGMKFRVSARAPHGVGVLLLVGGAVVAGAAAVVAWRHARRGCRRPAKREVVADGGVVEDGMGSASALETGRPDDNVQGDASPPGKTHRPDDNLRGEEEEEEDETEIGSKNGLLDNNGRVTEDEIQEVHDNAEIVADEGSVCSSHQAFEFQNSERVVETKIDLDLGKISTEISMLHDDVDIEHVEKYDKDSSTELPEATTHDTDPVPVEKIDEDSITKKDTEKDQDSTRNDTDDHQQDAATNHAENEENSSRSELEKQDGDCEEMEASDDQPSQQSMMMTTSRPGIVVLDEQSVVGGAQEAESMENSPTADLITHPEQLSDDDVMNDADGETTAEASELEEEGGAVSDNEAPAAEQGQQKAVTMGEPVGVVADAPPALSPSSPPVKVKPAAEKKEAESMENSPTAGLITHPEQLLDDDVANAADGETAAEAEPEEGAVSDKEDALAAEPVGVADAPPVLSFPVKVKPAEKIEAELPGRVVEAESMENSPTADLIMHPEQLLDDVMNAADGEAPEPEPEEGAVSDKEDAPAAEPVGVADALPALSSQEKPAEKKEAELPAGRVVEAGMKMEQDYATTNGGRVKERALIGGGGAVAGVVTVDRRSSSMAILALVFALTVGVAIALARLYAPPRATKLQMDLP